MDMPDGRVARWIGATSQFGVELDSLCDLVTFGVAPAILMYQLALYASGPAGIHDRGLFRDEAALRLARFNLRAQTGEPTTHFPGCRSRRRRAFWPPSSSAMNSLKTAIFR